MKRIISILISLLLITTSAFASGSIPEELMKTPENFTAVYNISVSIDDNSDIRSLIEEMISVENSQGSLISAGFLNFLSAMFEYNDTINVQADISSDYKKIKLSLTNSNVLNSVVSSNLNYTVKSKAGLWADIDLTNEEAPKLDVIYLPPTSDKYCYFNAGEYITKEDLDSFNTFFDFSEYQQRKDEISQLLYNNSKIEKTRTGYKLSLNNDNFVTFIKEMVAADYGYNEEIAEEISKMFQNVQLLGKNGITSTYTITNGQISYAETKADISVNISGIVMAMEGEWPYKASGIINMQLSEKATFTKIGTTVVEFPALNEKNSISLNKMIEEEMNMRDPDFDYGDYEIEYPYSYAGANCDKLPMVNGDYYIPFRAVLEDGYDETVSISYQEGVISASSEYFPEFKSLTMTIGDDKVYIDGAERAVGTVMLVDGVTYVNTRLFTDVFGWELCDMTHDMLDNSYTVGFWTYE